MSQRRRPHPRRARLRPRSAAQAFVEFALAAPFLLLLVAGAAQIGAIAYGMVSSDTAAREGARYGATHPNAALPGFSSSGGGTYHCVYANDNESVASGNPICQAVYRAHGLLDPTRFDITITSNISVMALQVPSDVVRVGQPLRCGSDAEVDGTITFNPAPSPSQRQSVTITATGQGTVPSTTVQGNQSAYRLCLALNTTQTLNAVMGSGCGGYSGQATVSVQQASSTPYTPAPDPLVLTPNPCPTPQPSQTPNPTPTPAPATPVPTDVPPPPFTCTNAAAQSNGYYFTVTVKYPVPIFVPVVGTMIGDPNNATQRTVQASVTERVEPCAITGNQ